MDEDRSCPLCGAPFGVRRRCYNCAPGRQRTGTTKPCKQCGKEFYVSLYQARDIARNSGTFCSVLCKNNSLRLSGPGARFKRPDGYIVVYYPAHPDSGKRNMVLEHRLVMERVLGRRLLRTEQVNHINHVRDDNRPENLELISPSDHSRETALFNNARRRREKAELAEYRRLYGPLPRKETQS